MFFIILHILYQNIFLCYYLIVSNESHAGRMRIVLGFGVSEGRTQVEVYPKGKDASFAEVWSPIIIDEFTGSMTRVYPIERSGK